MPLHVRDLGSGPPIVFLHPGPGLDGSVFLPGATHVADAGFRVLLFDLPGSGRSPAGDWTLAGQALAVEDAVNELGLEDWTLLGHSFGGYVAMQHLVDFGTASRLVASSTDADEEEPPGVDPDRWERHARRSPRGLRARGVGDDAGGVPRRLARSAAVLRR